MTNALRGPAQFITHNNMMMGMRVVARHHGTTTSSPAAPLRLVRQYASLPEPPTRPGTGGQWTRGNNPNFNTSIKAPVPSTRYTPIIPRSPQNSIPYFKPTKETLDTILKELNEKCEIYKYVHIQREKKDLHLTIFQYHHILLTSPHHHTLPYTKPQHHPPTPFSIFHHSPSSFIIHSILWTEALKLFAFPFNMILVFNYPIIFAFSDYPHLQLHPHLSHPLF